MSSMVEKEADASPRLPSKPQTPATTFRHSFLIVTNSALLVLGIGGPLLLRLYFIHGGHHFWLSTLVQVCGWPILLLILSISYLRRRRPPTPDNVPLLHLTRPLAAASAGIGLLVAFYSYMYGYGSSCLPLSTTSLLVSTQLAFTAVFALIIVRQRFTAYSVNSVVLLTLGPVVLGLGSQGERPKGESSGRYYLGFAMVVGAAAIIGMVLPLTELAYRRSKQKVTYVLVMEMQMVMGVFGTAVCLVGMAANREFQTIEQEAREFGLGKVKYFVVLITDAVFFQAINLGAMGLICSASSLLTGVLIAVLLPVTEVLSVFFFKENFNGSKGVALALSLWGFTSYLYGERKQRKKLNKAIELEIPQPIP